MPKQEQEIQRATVARLMRDALADRFLTHGRGLERYDRSLYALEGCTIDLQGPDTDARWGWAELDGALGRWRAPLNEAGITLAGSPQPYVPRGICIDDIGDCIGFVEGAGGRCYPSAGGHLVVFAPSTRERPAEEEERAAYPQAKQVTLFTLRRTGTQLCLVRTAQDGVFLRLYRLYPQSA